jgi:hypothetical protein
MTSPSPSGGSGSGSGTGVSESPQPDGGATSPSLLGDHRTADPCALTDDSALADFGYTDLDNDRGNFDGCDVLVSPEDDVWIDVEVSFAKHSHVAEDLQDPVPARTVGEIGIAEGWHEPDDCERVLLLPWEADADTVVLVDAESDDSDSLPLCEMADAAATSAAGSLDSLVASGDQIPRRSPPPEFTDDSLIWVDACGLLGADALATVPGIDAGAPYTYFGAWGCDWESGNGETLVGLNYHRDYSMSDDDDATPFDIGDRQGYLEVEEDGTCSAWVEQREYIDEYGETAVEMVSILVEGEGASEDELCGWVRDLATAAAGNLP